MTSILDFSFTRSSISIESGALAVPVIHAGFYRENPGLTDNHDSGIPSSNLGRPSRDRENTRAASLVVRTPDFSMSRRVLNGISHERIPISGYFVGIFSGVAQLVEHMSIKRGVLGSIPSPGAEQTREDMRMVYQPVDPVVS